MLRSHYKNNQSSANTEADEAHVFKNSPQRRRFNTTQQFEI